MNLTVKKIFSLLMLLAFLLPAVEKEIHSFEHKDDFHCTTKADKHFHEEAHNCSICDFNVPVVTESFEKDFSFILTAYSAHFIPVEKNRFLSAPINLLPPRAPPIA